MSAKSLLSRIFLLILLAGIVGALDPRLSSVQMAQAQDDDDDDGDDDDDDDDDDDGSGNRGSRGDGDDDDPVRRRGGEMPRFLRNLLGQPEPRRAVRRAAPPAPLPEYRAELVVLNLNQTDLDTLLAQGFAVIEQQTVGALNVTMRRLQAPPALDLPAARDVVRALPSGGDADFNHYYRSESCENCHAQQQIGWQMPPSRNLNCGADIAIGMVDTGINPDHETFTGSRLEVHRLDTGEEASGEMHGTSVASILVGDPASRTPGLVPHLRVVAVDAFHQAGVDERTDAFTLIRALDMLVEAEVRVINLSLAGPANGVLEQAVARVTGEHGIVVVAASGNGGARAEPAFPAAYPDVIAVTAVDRQGKVYRRAGRGDHVHIAAPGVEVWTAASISGGRPKTGTSFAAPFVSAAAARMLQADPALTPAMLAERLALTATDLGDAGRDDTYGHGLLTFAATCEAESAPLPVSQN